jgi:hypothetical protein
MADGMLEERLTCGGTLQVTEKSWQILYVFGGPTTRHRPRLFSIDGKSMSSYISALQENWRQYEVLKSKLPESSDYQKEVNMNMTVRVCPHIGGLYVHYPYLHVANTQRLDALVDSWRKAAQRAAELIRVLKSL